MMQQTRPDTDPCLSRRQILLAMMGTAFQLSGCGGGEQVAGISTGGTGSFTVGPVTGFGSVIVNGIRYDDSQAQLVRLDDPDMPADAALKLGMVVTVQGSAVSGNAALGTATATADRIHYRSEWRGPVESIDLGKSTFSLLGQTVRVSAATVFEGEAITRLGELSTGLQAEVYGYLDPATASLQATRVELSVVQPPSYLVSGRLVNSSVGTEFSIGNLPVRLGPNVTATAAEGSLVRAWLSPSPAAGRWTVLRLAADEARLGELEVDEDDEAEIEGSVTAWRSATSFSVNGIPVDASVVPGIATLGLQLGSVLEVSGTINRGVVVASEVKVKRREEVEAREFELHGQVEQLDSVARTFRTRGYVFHYDDATGFDLGGAGWANGLQVEVKAIQQDGRLYATKVESDDDD